MSLGKSMQPLVGNELKKSAIVSTHDSAFFYLLEKRNRIMRTVSESYDYSLFRGKKGPMDFKLYP